jgi:hypothetical protein
MHCIALIAFIIIMIMIGASSTTYADVSHVMREFDDIHSYKMSDCMTLRNEFGSGGVHSLHYFINSL